MKRLIAATLLAILATGMASAQKKNKKHDQVPAIFEHAKFVYVEAPEGAGRFGVVAGELQAISDVQASLQDWNRYTLAHRRRDADFVLVVIKGRIANGRGSTGVSIGPPMPPNSGANPVRIATRELPDNRAVGGVVRQAHPAMSPRTPTGSASTL